MAKKHYVLDTNILLQDPKSLFGFEDNHVYITSTTLQELDNHKKGHGETPYAARETSRILNKLFGDSIMGGNLAKTKIGLDNGGTLSILIDGISDSNLMEGYSTSSPDNRIISACVALKKEVKKNEPVILVSNDTLMRINAAVNSVPAQEYKNSHITDKAAEYKGIRTVELEDWSVIDDICDGAQVVSTIEEIENPVPNEFFILKSGTKSILAWYRQNKNGIYEYSKISSQHAMSIKGLNNAQNFALAALLAPSDEVPFVILKGAAGTAKTLLSIAAGLEQTYNLKKKRVLYNHIYITRANQLADADFGYLPGDLSNKMQELINPFTDNLEVILKKKDKTEEQSDTQTQIQALFDSQIIRLLPLSYIRGRSISNSYIIVDEAQNCSTQLMRDVITRIGNGSKLVVLGDPTQCDNHCLDSRDNGLVYLADKFKGSSLCAQITFDETMSVRSKLATEALTRLS